MALSPEDRAELQAMMVDVVGAANAELQRQLGEQLGDIKIDVEMALDKLDRLEIELKSELREVKLHTAQVSRKQFRDVQREESIQKKITDLERRIISLEKGI